MRYQEGYIWRERGVWFGRWREDVLIDGKIVRKQKSRKLADCDDRYRTESDVRPLLDEILRPFNEGKMDARSTMPIVEYVDKNYLPFVRENHKPSTYNGYEKLWRKHLKPRVCGKIMRDFRTVDAANLFADIARSGLGRRSLQHTKSLLSGIFTLAKNQGILDGMNPVQDAMLSKKAKPPAETYATSSEDVLLLLSTFKRVQREASGTEEYRAALKTRAAIALVFFCGLRPGEARGANWEDYDGKRLTIRRSVWRTHVTAPKTAASAKPVPIVEPLRSILAELHQAEGSPASGSILRGFTLGRSLNLDMLARNFIRTTLTKCVVCRVPKAEHKAINHAFKQDPSLPEWHGWYSFRRGIATLTATITKDPMAAKGLLRHSSLITTANHYIKDVPEVTERAMEQVEKLFAGTMCSKRAVEGTEQQTASLEQVQ